MRYEQAPATGAYFGPLATAIILRHCTNGPAEPVDLDELADRYERAGEVAAARQLRYGLAMGRLSECLRKQTQAGTGSVVASSEVPETAGGAGSGRPPRPGTRWLSVAEVAERYGVWDVQVRKLCRDEVLSATRLKSRGRPWSIDPESVREYLEMRSRG